MADWVSWIGGLWLALALGVLLGHFLWPRPAVRVVERRRRHGTPADRKPDPVRHLPPPPAEPVQVRSTDRAVPPTAAIPRADQLTMSERGEPVCTCDHDLLDHASSGAQLCFQCRVCAGFRARPRLTPPQGRR